MQYLCRIIWIKLVYVFFATIILKVSKASKIKKQVSLVYLNTNKATVYSYPNLLDILCILNYKKTRLILFSLLKKNL